MRELSLTEVEAVNGAGILDKMVGPTGIFSSTQISAASRFAGGVGLLYGSWEAGQAIGKGINHVYGAASYYLGGTGSLGGDMYNWFR